MIYRQCVACPVLSGIERIAWGGGAILKRLDHSSSAAPFIERNALRAAYRYEATTSDLTVHIGLGLARRAYVTIKWPSGIIQTWPGNEAAYGGGPDVVADARLIFNPAPRGELGINRFNVIEEMIGGI